MATPSIDHTCVCYLAVLLRELLVGADDVVEVRVHELRADVHVVERLRDRRRDHVPDAYDLFILLVDLHQ
jgi:hypothetical protein